MRIIRYMAPDTRAALRGIREQLGDDAVILSSKRTPEGVEVTAAVDFDATRLENSSVPLAQTPAPAKASARRASETARPAPASRAAAARMSIPAHPHPTRRPHQWSRHRHRRARPEAPRE